MVLTFLREKWEPLSSLTLQQLTYKTVFMIALATSRRVSALNFLSGLSHDIQFSSSGDNSVCLNLLPEFRAKNQAANVASDPIVVKSLCEILGPDDKDRCLCPVRCLKAYLRRTSALRGRRRKLFLSVNPNYSQDIRVATISRWIVSVIKDAYKDSADQPLSTKAHEVRALSTSLALSRGVSVHSILRAAYWRGRMTFVAHYLRDLEVVSQDGQASFSALVLAQNLC